MWEKYAMSNIVIISCLVFGWMIITLVTAVIFIIVYWIKTGSLIDAIHEIF